MSDQQNEWWTTPGATPPAQPPPPDAPAPSADPDATVVVPTRHPGAPAAGPGPSVVPPQYAPQPAVPAQQPLPPGGQPPQYGGQPPQYSAQPPQYGAQPPHGAPSYGGPQFVEPAGPTSRYRSPGGSITMLVGALIAIIGTFLPWVTFPGGSVNGYERYLIGDGFDATVWNNPGGFVVFAMVIVIVAAIVVLAAGRRIATWIIALLAAGFGGLMSVAAFGAVGSVLNNDFTSDELGVGFGIALCLLGAVVSGVGAIIVAAKKA